MKQKYNKNDLIRVIKELPCYMSHFECDCEAIVLGTYSELCYGTDIESYSLYIKGRGDVSWYKENQLILIEVNRGDLLEKWKKEEKEERDIKSDLDWIFANSEEVLEDFPEASISKLASCFGLTNLWGASGEGFIYYQNFINTIETAKPFLLNKDKLGWLEFCEKHKWK